MLIDTRARAQGLVEYGLIIALVAVLAIAGLIIFGPAISGLPSTTYPLVLPLPTYGLMISLLTMAASTIILILVAAGWFIRRAWKTSRPDNLTKFYSSEAGHLEKAWRQGRLRPGTTVIEASSGSTSIALALVQAQPPLTPFQSRSLAWASWPNVTMSWT